MRDVASIDKYRVQKRKRWWQRKGAGIERDIYEALIALRHDVENQGNKKITLSGLSTYRERELTRISTVRVGPWEFGYLVKETDAANSFFMRKLYIKLHGDRLRDVSERERESLINSVASAIFDQGNPVEVEWMGEHVFAILQPFAIMFLHENNPNIVTPSKELLLKAFDPARQPAKEDGNG